MMLLLRFGPSPECEKRLCILYIRSTSVEFAKKGENQEAKLTDSRANFVCCIAQRHHVGRLRKHEVVGDTSPIEI